MIHAGVRGGQEGDHGADVVRVSIRPILGDVTSHWATLVLAALMTRPHRFSELAAQIGGISEKMLPLTLRTLTRDGLVTRTVVLTVPIQVTYELTALGVNLTRRLKDLVTWVERHTSAIQTAQAAYDADTPVPPAIANRR